MCTFGVLWLSCASPCGPVWWGRRGFTRQPESPNVHISGSRRFKNTTKFHEKTSQRERKKRRKDPQERKERKRNFRREREKKRAKFWAVQRKRPKILNPPHTQTTTTNKHHQQAPPSGTTNKHHQQAPTGTKQPPTGTNRHQQAPTGTTTENLAKTLETQILAKCGHENKLAKFWPHAVWPNAGHDRGLTPSLPLNPERDRLRPISTSASFFFRVRPIRVRPISSSANFEFGQFRLRPTFFGC